MAKLEQEERIGRNIEAEGGYGAIGVAFYIVSADNKVLTGEETEGKPGTKEAGDRAIPMETVEPGETLYATALRLRQEEVPPGVAAHINITPESLEEYFVGAAEVPYNGSKALAYCFVIRVPISSEKSNGLIESPNREVINLKWEDSQVIINNAEKFRPGVGKIVERCRADERGFFIDINSVRAPVQRNGHG